MKKVFAVTVVALATSGTALAKKKSPGVASDTNGLRVKISQDLFGRQQQWTELDGDEGDKTVTDSLSLLNGAGRVEATKLVGNGLEVGGLLSYTYADQKFDGDDVSQSQGYSVGLTGAYNIKLTDTAKGFIQPMAGLSRSAFTPDGGDERAEQGIWFGAAAGARIKLFKRVTFDPQLEYLQTTTTYELDGESQDSEGKQTNLGLRWGLSIML